MLIEKLLTGVDVSTTDSAPSALLERFKQGLEKLAQMGQAEGMPLVAYNDPALPAFRILPISQQALLTDVIHLYIDVMESTIAQKEAIRFNLNSVWRMLGRLKIRGADDLFERLEPTDIIEIYTLSGLQIFRSFHFFEVCSYTLEDLFCVPWYGLFTRPEHIDQIYFEDFRAVATGQIAEVSPGKIPIHEVRERFGPRGLVTIAEPRIAVPLKGRDGIIRGVLHSFRVKVITANA